LLPETIFAPLMKKLIAIFFIMIGSLQFLPDINYISYEMAVCLETDEDKGNDKNIDGKKEKGEMKEYLIHSERINANSFTLQLHHSAHIFSLQQPVADILTPPPDHC
jgi:hypothetical protein